MNLNLGTLIGQSIAMIVFVWFCMKYIWPVIMNAIEQRQTEIANGLAAAEKGQSSLATAKVEVDKIIEQGRGTKEVAQARQLAMFLMKELTSASLKTIGQRFGGRDHSTVVHAIKTIEKAMERDDSFKKSVDAILSKLSR